LQKFLRFRIAAQPFQGLCLQRRLLGHLALLAGSLARLFLLTSHPAGPRLGQRRGGFRNLCGQPPRNTRQQGTPGLPVSSSRPACARAARFRKIAVDIGQVCSTACRCAHSCRNCVKIMVFPGGIWATRLSTS
jgi:hypothetical protein